MNKDNNYWNIHKEVYMDEFDKLDKDIAKIVQTKPLSHEAELFNKKVDETISIRLKENSKVVG
jgi:hypothetical protein